MMKSFSRRNVRDLGARAHTTTYFERGGFVFSSIFFLFVWLGLGAFGVAKKAPFVWFVGLQLFAVPFGIRRKKVERDGERVAIRRYVLGVLPLPRDEDEIFPDRAGVPLDLAQNESARASVTLTSQTSFNKSEGGELVPVTETETTTFDCAFDSTTYRHTGSKPVPFTQDTDVPFTETPVRITALEPWPCFEVEYRDFNRGGRPKTCRFEPAPGEDPSKLDLVVEALLKNAEDGSRRKKNGERIAKGYTDVNVVIERGWAAIPHALWAPVEAFPEALATDGGPYREYSGERAERWKWTITEDEKGDLRRGVPSNGAHETTPERIAVVDGTLFAQEAGSSQVGSIPLGTLREVMRLGEGALRFRFGRATDVILPAKSAAAIRLRELPSRTVT